MGLTMNSKPIRQIILLGPTAVGKTNLSIGLAERLKTSIVSVDARQSYRYLDIGTAKVSVEQRKQIPHFNVDCLDPADSDSPFAFLERIQQWDAEYLQAHPNTPLIYVGGSTLYLSGLINGLDPMPKANPARVTQLKEQARTEGIEMLYEKLIRVDADYARKMDGLNPQRIIRALDVYFETGKPFSSFHSNKSATCPNETLVIGLNRPRSSLHERIEKRVDHMMQQGLVDEVRGLLQKGYSLENQALQTVGYSEIILHLNGELSLEEAVEKIKTHTRRYAKRQETWFRKWPFIQWFYPEEQTELEILSLISKEIKSKSN
jgi:tRNA dimethylallyltransferase